MENIKEIVRENLIKFRKEKKLTQMELSQSIGYSDKAISRWETGEVTPDIETLNALSELYGVPISAFFEKSDGKVITGKQRKIPTIGNRMAISLISIVGLWVIATVIFALLSALYPDNANWLAFIWAIPASFVLAVIFNAIWGKRFWTFAFVSLLVWSLILAAYLQFAVFNTHLWLLFVVGAPVQVCIVLVSFIHGKIKKDEQ